MKKLWGASLVTGMLCVLMCGALPDTVATHFGVDGQANGWMSRTVAIFFFGLFPLVLTGIFALSIWTVRISNGTGMNVPNAEYWRQPANFQRAVVMIEQWMSHLGLGCNVLFLVVTYLVVQAQRNTPPVLNSQAFLILMGGFFVFVGFLAVRLTRQFRVS